MSTDAEPQATIKPKLDLTTITIIASILLSASIILAVIRHVNDASNVVYKPPFMLNKHDGDNIFEPGVETPLMISQPMISSSPTSNAYECSGDETLCVVTTTVTPVETLTKLIAALPAGDSKQYSIRLSVTPIDVDNDRKH